MKSFPAITAVASVGVIVSSLALAGVLSSCSSGTSSSPDDVTASAQEVAVVTGYAEMAESSYASAVQGATALKESIAALVAAPSQATLDAAKSQWLTARDAYVPTEVFRFSNGPIDALTENPDIRYEQRINAWPIDESAIDGVADGGPSGIINDVESFPELSAPVIADANQRGGDNATLTGWHVIEYVLWGLDTNPNGPGNRPVTDFTSGANAKRRGVFLALVADQLVADLTKVRDAWAVGSEYQKQFVSAVDVSLTSILHSAGALSAGELAGGRVGFAFESKDPDDEPSGYSDNMNADIRNDVLGIKGVYLGELGGKKVASISSLVAAQDPALDTKLQQELDAGVLAASTFPAPFDQMIVGADGSPGRVALKNAITAFQTQADTIVAVGDALGLDVTLTI
jgi:putative iron-regulated protein